jgi:hypothetical protein
MIKRRRSQVIEVTSHRRQILLQAADPFTGGRSPHRGGRFLHRGRILPQGAESDRTPSEYVHHLMQYSMSLAYPLMLNCLITERFSSLNHCYNKLCQSSRYISRTTDDCCNRAARQVSATYTRLCDIDLAVCSRKQQWNFQ